MNKNLITPVVPNQDSQDMDDLRIVECLNLATLPEPSADRSVSNSLLSAPASTAIPNRSGR